MTSSALLILHFLVVLQVWEAVHLEMMHPGRGEERYRGQCWQCDAVMDSKRGGRLPSGLVLRTQEGDMTCGGCARRDFAWLLRAIGLHGQ